MQGSGESNAIPTIIVHLTQGGVSALLAQGGVSALLPTIMALTGTVVAGTGTFHGATTAALASFAVSPTVLPVIAIGSALARFMLQSRQ